MYSYAVDHKSTKKTLYPVWTNTGLALRLHDTGTKIIWIWYEMNTVRRLDWFEYGIV